MASSNDTTFSVYRIVCFATGKVYVGRTNAKRTREATHFRLLERHKHSNNHLQWAYDKYGRQSFYFEVLESGLSADQINQREIYWIAHFDSFNKGYNQTEGGGGGQLGNGKKCIWNGIEYLTIAECARANGVTLHAMQGRFLRGNTCDADLSPRTTAVVWNGIEYPSIAEAARANGITPKAMQLRISKGRKSDSDLTHYKPCVWNGVNFPSIVEAAEANGLTKGALWRRLLKGYTSDTDMPGRLGKK